MGQVTEDVEKVYKRLFSHQDVIGLLLLDEDGRILRSTLPEEHARQYAMEVPALAIMARSAAREIEPKDYLNMVRIKSRKHEMMIVAEENFTLMILQEYPGYWIEPPPPPATPPGDSDDDFDGTDET